MNVTVRDRDKGGKKLVAALAELARGVHVTVGVHEDAGAEEHRGPSNATVAQVAASQEFRGNSYLRSTIDEQRPAIERSLAAAARRAVKSAIHGTGTGGEIERAFGRVAARWAKKVQARVRRLGLVASAHLLESIEGRVRGHRVPDEGDGGAG